MHGGILISFELPVGQVALSVGDALVRVSMETCSRERGGIPPCRARFLAVDPRDWCGACLARAALELGART